MQRLAHINPIKLQQILNRMAVLLACVCAVSVLLYGIFLLEAVAHAASQTNAQRQIHQLSADLGDLEAQYLSFARQLTKEKAIALGFVMPQDVTTVFATAAVGALSLRGAVSAEPSR